MKALLHKNIARRCVLFVLTDLTLKHPHAVGSFENSSWCRNDQMPGRGRDKNVAGREHVTTNLQLEEKTISTCNEGRT